MAKEMAMEEEIAAHREGARVWKENSMLDYERTVAQQGVSGLIIRAASYGDAEVVTGGGGGTGLHTSSLKVMDNPSIDTTCRPHCVPASPSAMSCCAAEEVANRVVDVVVPLQILVDEESILIRASLPSHFPFFFLPHGCLL